MTAPLRPWQPRWADMLSTGFGTEADLRWFTSPHGLLTVCRDLPPEDLRHLVRSPAFDDLLADLDDRSIAFPGPLPSDRARALVEVALAPVTAVVGTATRQALAPAGADPDDPSTGVLIEAALGDLRDFRADGVAGDRRQVTVPIVVSHHAHGDVVLIAVSASPRPGVAPDITAAPFQRLDHRFSTAVAEAVRAVDGRPRSGLRYQALSRRTGAPVEAIGGPSVGLGAAVAVRRLFDPSVPTVDPEWVFTGTLDAAGSVGSLLGPDGTGEYRAKVTAVSRGTLVFPEADRGEVERRCEAEGVEVRLEPVADLAGVELLIDRHLEGRRAYQRALDPGARPPRAARALIAGVVAGLLAVVAVVALGAGYRSHQARAAADEVRERAAGIDPLQVPVPDGAGGTRMIDMDRTEVTNDRYAVCVDQGVCPPPVEDLQARDIRDPANGAYPVTGIDARAAEIFCRFARGAGWGLPTLDQFVAVNRERMALEDPRVGLVGSAGNGGVELPSEISIVLSPALGVGGFSYLRGNVSEWTRSTSCEADGCQDLPSVGDAGYTMLRIFGISYERMAVGLDPDLDLLIAPDQPESLIESTATPPDVGFRCAASEP